VQEPEDNAEAPDAPMVPGLQPPSPRPMVHDPLDRQENEPQQLTAAELARWVVQLCKLCACSTKHCMFSLAHLNSLMCCKSLVSRSSTVSKSKVRVYHAVRTADEIRPLHTSACTYTAFCRDACSPICCCNFLWVCMQHTHLHLHAERAQLCTGAISILLQAAGTDAA